VRLPKDSFLSIQRIALKGGHLWTTIWQGINNFKEYKAKRALDETGRARNI